MLGVLVCFEGLPRLHAVPMSFPRKWTNQFWAPLWTKNHVCSLYPMVNSYCSILDTIIKEFHMNSQSWLQNSSYNLFIKDKQRRNWTIRAVTQPLVLWEEGRHLVKCCSNFSEKYVSNKLTHTEETFSCSNPEPTCRRPMTQEEHTHSGVLSEDWSSTCHVSVVTPSWFWLPFNSGKVLECEKYSVDLGSFTILSNQTL